MIQCRLGCTVSHLTSVDELRLLMENYEKEKSVLTARNNTLAAAKAREDAWQRIADKLNACTTMGVKRTWKQVKTKYKNIIQSANKKKREERKTGEGSPLQDFSPADELHSLVQDQGRPIKDGRLRGSCSQQASPTITRSSDKVTSGSVSLPDPRPKILDKGELATLVRDEETISVFSDHVKRSRSQTLDEDIKTTYQRYLQEQTEYYRLKRRKVELEIKLLEKQLNESSSSSSSQ
nr:PREDICTED: uncharacterized protein LOC107078715 isoform X2 [Lepisosteus oculatus]